jgi:hypothetical protein
LNEIIIIKYELGILVDRNGKLLKDYEFIIDNDEIIISDENGIYEYNFKNKESQRVQEAIFHEKQTIIESCLFGVDINPNSVKICRLRLWIELLKSSYYKQSNNSPLERGRAVSEGVLELETLPNIDINIKCGNSLISRFALDADLSKALKSIKYDIDAYRGFVSAYKNEKNREVKRGLQTIIDSIKSDFRTEISKYDPKLIRLEKATGELFNHLNQTSMFDMSEKQKKEFESKKKKLETEIEKLTKEVEEIKSNAIYKNAFEWRFEFPEVLNDNGDFVGFDVVIGNPPYFSLSTDERLRILINKFETYTQTGDIYSLFYELSNWILKKEGFQTLIISNKWMRANYGYSLRKYILEKTNPLMLIDFGQNLLFESAIVHTSIILAKRTSFENNISGIRIENNKNFELLDDFYHLVDNRKINNLQFDFGVWSIIDSNLRNLKDKIEDFGLILKKWNIEINFGLKTGLNEAFIIDKKVKDQLIAYDDSSEIFIKPILRGRDTRKYYADFKEIYLINIPKGYTAKTNIGRTDIVMEPRVDYIMMENEDAWDWFLFNHRGIAKHLLKFRLKAKKRQDKGDYWWELRACSYIDKFQKPKIIYSEIVSEPQFYYDEKGYYPEATVFFISGDNLKYLTALLNSKAVTFFFKTFYMGGELVGKIRYKKAFLEQVPIPKISQEAQQPFIDLVDIILAKKERNEDTAIEEAEIDRMVYELYGLTEEEIKVVEGVE